MDSVTPVALTIDGALVASETRVVSAAAEVLVLSTSIAAAHAPFTLHSTYVGRRGQPTAATHLLLAPGTSGTVPEQRLHEAPDLPVAEDERQLCLYDHLQRLLAALTAHGHAASVDVGDRSVSIVNR